MVIVMKNDEECFDENLLWLIGKQYNVEAIAILKNVPHELTDCNERTLLHQAAIDANPVLVQYLIDRGCELDATDVHGNTPLHFAVWFSLAPVVEALLKNGANVNAREKHGYTPLHLYDNSEYTDQQEKLKILKTLMDHGASLYLLDDKGMAAFEGIFHFGNKETLQMLLRYDVDLFARDARDNTPLHFLAGNNNYRAVELIEGRKFDIDARNSNGDTALFKAIFHARVNTVEFLLKHGANVSVVNNQGERTLNTAAFSYVVSLAADRKKRRKIVELLLQYGADAQSLDYEQVEWVILDFHLPLVKLVLAHLAMIESQDQVITEFTRTKINSKDIYQDYFAKCRQQLEELKKVTVYESVTLFKLLTEHPDRIIHYAFNRGFVPKFETIVRKLLGKVHSYYYHALRRRVGQAIHLAQLKLRAATAVQELTGFHVISHRIIVNKIADYLNGQDLKNVIYEEQELLLPLNSIFSTEN